MKPAVLVIALVRRWFYLLFIGMWRGQCAITIWDGWRIKVAGVGKPTDTPGIATDFRIFYP